MCNNMESQVTTNQLSAKALPETGFIRQAQLIPHILPFSSATLWRMVKNGTFAKPVKLSERVTAWRCEDVRSWIATKSEVGGKV